jgi:hypothetical protein
MKIWRTALVAALWVAVSPVAARADAPTEPSSAPVALDRLSGMVGGFAIGPSLLLLAKLEYGRGRCGLGAGVTRDSVEERRGSGGRDDYVLWSASLGARCSTGGDGRGVFAEVNAGYAWLALHSTDALGRAAEDRGSLPLVAAGLGARWGPRPTGLFGEIGFRTALALAREHLYTDAVPPPGSTDRMLSERSWYFAPGATTSQLYLGLGWDF